MDPELYKFKRLIKYLDSLAGKGTSLVSLLIPAGDSLVGYNNMLTTELGTASNVKSRVNRLSILSAITSVQQRLKMYAKTPPNGLVIYSGVVGGDGGEGKEKKITMDFEPFRPLTTSRYWCGSQFELEPLRQMLSSDGEKIGFIIFDGSSCVLALFSDNIREILYTKEVELPGKTRRGGQSSNRFARLAESARDTFVTLMNDQAKNHFISNGEANVTKIIIGGYASMKDRLVEKLDDRLKRILVKVVDVSYGGMRGLDQAIAESKDILKDIKLTQESKSLSEIFSMLSRGDEKVVYGQAHILEAIDQGCLEKLVLYDNTEGKIGDDDTIDWFLRQSTEKKFDVELVSHFTSQGSQLVSGFGGIIGKLRYKCVFSDEIEIEKGENDTDIKIDEFYDEDFI